MSRETESIFFGHGILTMIIPFHFQENEQRKGSFQELKGRDASIPEAFSWYIASSIWVYTPEPGSNQINS